MKKLWTLASLLLLLASCGPTAMIEKNESIDFSNYKTFDWLHDKADSSAVWLSDVQEDNLVNAINSQLQDKGLLPDNKDPQLLLKYDILLEKTIRERSDPVYSQGYYRNFYNPYTRRYISVYYPSRFLGYDRSAYQTREGTLTISMIDAKTEKVVWQGWTTQDVGSSNITSSELTAAARTIMRKFRP
ncbi:MAG: DUF4136 domain-containing protein [Chitinophagaceae bacterium]|nr:MAG: DUF4136 domain-containing protein [Chitinophagaceae bacterium]